MYLFHTVDIRWNQRSVTFAGILQTFKVKIQKKLLNLDCLISDGQRGIVKFDRQWIRKIVKNLWNFSHLSFRLRIIVRHDWAFPCHFLFSCCNQGLLRSWSHDYWGPFSWEPFPCSYFPFSQCEWSKRLRCHGRCSWWARLIDGDSLVILDMWLRITSRLRNKEAFRSEINVRKNFDIDRHNASFLKALITLFFLRSGLMRCS